MPYFIFVMTFTVLRFFIFSVLRPTTWLLALLVMLKLNLRNFRFWRFEATKPTLTDWSPQHTSLVSIYSYETLYLAAFIQMLYVLKAFSKFFPSCIICPECIMENYFLCNFKDYIFFPSLCNEFTIPKTFDFI